jgi:type II secretory pathway pseudopilin PulG
MRRATRAFSLVELLVVIGIIVLLMGIIVATYQGMSSQNRRSSCAANLKAIGQALAIFRDDYGCFPPDSTEFLWTEEAVTDYRTANGESPPGDSSLGTLTGAAYNPDGTPIDTGVRGLGLFTLYYLGIYSAQFPPEDSEERLYDDDGNLLAALDSKKGLKDLGWFRGSGYLDNVNVFHCPANKTDSYKNEWLAQRQGPDDDDDGTPDTPGISYLGEWANYDRFYRRNYWGNENSTATEGLKQTYQPTEWTEDNFGHRHLFQPYPPADTVVTWCPHHRKSSAPKWPGDPEGDNPAIEPGDMDIVLFADGSVRRMAAQQANEMFNEPIPQGPAM